MSPEQATDIIRQALYMAMQVSAPFLVLAMAVGLVVALMQSVTQVSELTLTIVPKILVVGVALAALAPWILKTMTQYALSLLVNQWEQVTSLSRYYAS